jgi:hypothetical protein
MIFQILRVFPALIPHGELLFQTPQKGGELFRGGELIRGRNYCLKQKISNFIQWSMLKMVQFF